VFLGTGFGGRHDPCRIQRIGGADTVPGGAPVADMTVGFMVDGL